MTAKPIMVQGTMSGVGKSWLVAALCRILAQDGLRALPFKSQNMALNSFVTPDGLEIGRAQAMQAEAAGVEPDVCMNPVLLKPTSDTGSQVVVMGRPIGTMSAREYFAYKRQLIPTIRDAYARLAERCDVVIIEGAGSPVEVNLKADDIVNMGLARMVATPVLLVGDIDRGGVFAQLIGTMDLLEPAERALVKATVVNKFRGDASLLEPGLDVLRERTGVPVAGVVPWLAADLDDEDSLSDRIAPGAGAGSPAALDIAVVRLPRMANFTDFIALEALSCARVRYVARPADVGSPDLLVLPGTKATLSDLRWLRESGLATVVERLAGAGVPVVGICGGYQMLGAWVCDAAGVEGGGREAGLGLLPVETEFNCRDKRTVRSSGVMCEMVGPLAGCSGAAVEGYEVHMGITRMVDVPGAVPGRPLVALEGGGFDGCQAGNVYGTYLHGLFDSAAMNGALAACLLVAKGIDPDEAAGGLDLRAYKQRQYDELARGARGALDLALIREIIEKGA